MVEIQKAETRGFGRPFGKGLVLRGVVWWRVYSIMYEGAWKVYGTKTRSPLRPAEGLISFVLYDFCLGK